MLTDLGKFIAQTPALRNESLVCREWIDVTAFGEKPWTNLIQGHRCQFPRYMPHVCMCAIEEKMTQ